MVYGIIRLINFAHGEVFMVGGFAGLAAYTYALEPAGLSGNVWIALPLVMIASAVITGALGLTLERVAYRPLRNAPRLAPLITAVGASFFLQNVVFLWYPGARSPVPFPRVFPPGRIEFLGAR